MRIIDADGSFTINATDNTGYSLAFGGGIISCADEFGHIEAEFFTDDIPTVGDVAPVRHAFWEKIGADRRDRGGIFRCAGADGCGKTHPYTCDYCPNCGARMDGAGNGEEED